MSTTRAISKMVEHKILGELCSRLDAEDAVLFRALWWKYHHLEDRHVWLLLEFACLKAEESKRARQGRLATKIRRKYQDLKAAVWTRFSR